MLDPFLGIGNSAVAALDCELHQFIGFEIDSSYLKTANELINEHIQLLAANNCANMLDFHKSPHKQYA